MPTRIHGNGARSAAAGLRGGRDVTADHDNKFRAPCLDRRDKLTLAGQIADYSETQRHML
jgi:hypothetical protein